MQGFFPDRGVLGRQGRDTDASNGEVRAERQVLGPACGLVFETKVLSKGLQEKGDVASVVGVRGDEWSWGVWRSASCAFHFCLVVLFQAEAITCGRDTARDWWCLLKCLHWQEVNARQ